MSAPLDLIHQRSPAQRRIGHRAQRDPLAHAARPRHRHLAHHLLVLVHLVEVMMELLLLLLLPRVARTEIGGDACAQRRHQAALGAALGAGGAHRRRRAAHGDRTGRLVVHLGERAHRFRHADAAALLDFDLLLRLFGAAAAGGRRRRRQIVGRTHRGDDGAAVRELRGRRVDALRGRRLELVGERGQRRGRRDGGGGGSAFLNFGRDADGRVFLRIRHHTVRRWRLLQLANEVGGRWDGGGGYHCRIAAFQQERRRRR